MSSTTSSAAGILEILMPSMGEGVQEATFVRWIKKQGESVVKGEPLFEVSTDKVDTEIPANESGILHECLAEEGATVNVHQRIGSLSVDKSSGGSVSKNTAPIAASTKTLQAADNPTRAVASPGQRMNVNLIRRTSPLVRKMAKDLNIDLNDIRGTGINGKIRKDDLNPTNQNRSTVPPSSTPKFIPKLVEMTDRREKMTKMRKLIADHMVESVRVSPHVTTVFEIDMYRIAQHREQNAQIFLQRQGFKLTYTAYLLYAAVRAILENPIVNVSVDGDEIVHKAAINLGCAVAIENGLIVPVIKNAQKLDLYGIARSLNDLVTRAKTKKLTADDVQDGTFSVTNPGGFGSLNSNPIINQPQVAILGIGTIVKRPVVINDMIAIRPMMLASLTFDHRVIDGAGGAAYLASYKRILEDFETR